MGGQTAGKLVDIRLKSGAATDMIDEIINKVQLLTIHFPKKARPIIAWLTDEYGFDKEGEGIYSICCYAGHKYSFHISINNSANAAKTF